MVGCLICGLNGWLKGSGIRCFLEHNLITLRALFLFFLHFFLDACLAFLLALPRFLFLGIVILIKYFFIVNGT